MMRGWADPTLSVLLVLALLLLAAAAVVVPLGTAEAVESPQYAAFEQEMIRAHATTTDGQEALNPAGRMALVVSLTPAFDACVSCFVLLGFGVSVPIIRGFTRELHPVGVCMTIGFSLMCLMGAGMTATTALNDSRWRFGTRAIGHALAAAGLASGTAAVLGKSLTAWKPAPSTE